MSFVPRNNIDRALNDITMYLRESTNEGRDNLRDMIDLIFEVDLLKREVDDSTSESESDDQPMWDATPWPNQGEAAPSTLPAYVPFLGMIPAPSEGERGLDSPYSAHSVGPNEPNNTLELERMRSLSISECWYGCAGCEEPETTARLHALNKLANALSWSSEAASSRTSPDSPFTTPSSARAWSSPCGCVLPGCAHLSTENIFAGGEERSQRYRDWEGVEDCESAALYREAV